MNDIIIVGAGGFGLELSEYIKQDIESGSLKNVSLKGFLDDQTEAYKRENIKTPYLGTITEYQPERNDRLLIAIGNPYIRRIVHERLSVKKCRYMSYIHSSAYVSKTAVIKEGVIVCPYSIVNSSSVLDEYSLINVFCSIGHGARVGKYSVLSPYSAVNGDASLGCQCFMGTRATVFPKVSVGENCTIDSHSYAKKSVENDYIISNRSKYIVVKKRIIQ